MRTSLRRRGGLAAAAALTAAATVAALAVTSAPAPADTGAACGVAYAIAWQTPSDSPPDFGATVTVTNNSSYPISGWSVTWSYTAGQSIVAGSAYSANVTQTGSTVTATPEAGYNASLAAGASATWGFHADYNGTSNPVPAITCTGPSQGSGSATLSGPLDPLGVNTAAWDSNFTDPAIASDLSAAGVGLIRYPGGSRADQYLWQPNTVNGSAQPVSFAQYASQVDAVTGGQKLVTVNYGSDTPQSAAAWVQQSATAGEGVNLWEVGNEEYGSWETDNHAKPVGALFAAANALEWLSFGAQSIDWWDVHNYGSPTADFGMFSSATSGEPAMDTPYPPYYGYQLASKLAVKGAKVGILPIATPNIYSYYSDLPDGSYAVVLINADPANSYQVSTSSLGITSPAETEYTYDAANPSVVSSSFSGGSVSVPAQSIVVLTNASGGPPTPTPTPTTPTPTPTTPTPTPTTPTPTPTTPTPTPTSSPGSGCQVSWSVVNAWSGGFQLGFTVTNSGTAPTSAWKVTWSWPGAQSLTQIWNATASASGAAVSAANASYNGSIPAAGTASFGLLGSGSTPAALTGLQCSAH